jgi:hypothetical protein
VSAPDRYHLIELSRPDANWQELETLSARARAAADEVRSEGAEVRFLRSIFEPKSGSCFLLVEAPSAREADLVTERMAAAARSTPNGGQAC